MCTTNSMIHLKITKPGKASGLREPFGASVVPSAFSLMLGNSCSYKSKTRSAQPHKYNFFFFVCVLEFL